MVEAMKSLDKVETIKKKGFGTAHTRSGCSGLAPKWTKIRGGGGCSKDALIAIFTCTTENEARIISFLMQISVKDVAHW
jgi:hypothetical protein